MAQEFILSDRMNVIKKHCSGHLSTAYTTGTITAGTPVKIDLTNLVNTAEKDFEISGGGIKYLGTESINIQGVASVSTSASENGTIVKYYRGKNGTVNLNSELTRKIGNGGDLGALALVFGGMISQNDIIEIYADSSDGGTVTIENFNYSIENITF